MKRGAAAAFLLLALAGCGREPAASNAIGAAPRPADTGSGAPHPVAPTAEPDTANGPRESFIVCPGNPRCPKDGSQPQGGRN